MNTRYEFNMDVPPREAIRLLYVSKSRFGGDWNSVRIPTPAPKCSTAWMDAVSSTSKAKCWTLPRTTWSL